MGFLVAMTNYHKFSAFKQQNFCRGYRSCHRARDHLGHWVESFLASSQFLVQAVDTAMLALQLQSL